MNIYRLMYNPRPAKNIQEKKAFIVGGGIAGLAAAVFLIDDAKMPGQNITIIDKRAHFGGCCDGYFNGEGYVYPGERELEPFMECLWYLCSKISSLEEPGRTILDEAYESNQENPIHSECRVLVDHGHIWEKIHDFRIKDPAASEKVVNMIGIPEEQLEDMTIADYYGEDSEIFDSAGWWCGHTMLAFKPWHSILEYKRYSARFGLSTRIDYLEGILHTKRNESDSIIKPILKWLEERGVNFKTKSRVYDLDLDEACNTVQAIKIYDQEDIPVRPEDLVFVTNGSMMTNATFGDNTHIAPVNRDTSDMGLFTIWQNLAKKHEKFGHPEKFISSIDKTK